DDDADECRGVNIDSGVGRADRAAVGDAAREGRFAVDFDTDTARDHAGIADAAGKPAPEHLNGAEGRIDGARSIYQDAAADEARIENLAVDLAIGNSQRTGDRPGITDIAAEGRVDNRDCCSDASIRMRKRSGIGHGTLPANVSNGALAKP